MIAAGKKGRGEKGGGRKKKTPKQTKKGQGHF